MNSCVIEDVLIWAGMVAMHIFSNELCCVLLYHQPSAIKKQWGGAALLGSAFFYILPKMLKSVIVLL